MRRQTRGYHEQALHHAQHLSFVDRTGSPEATNLSPAGDLNMVNRRMFSAALIASATSSLIARGAKAQIAPEVRTRPSGARFADKPEDFAKLGIQPGRIEPFEDGMRTEGGPGGYEWWYFDSHLHDGSSLVIVFYTKPQLNPDGELAPFASLELNRSGRPPIRVEAHVSPDAFSARRDRCDVRIGENTFRGNLHDYDVDFSHDDVTVDVKLTGQVPSWRPTSGYMYFGEHDEHVLAWLPAVPQGEVSGLPLGISISEGLSGSRGSGSVPRTLVGTPGSKW